MQKKKGIAGEETIYQGAIYIRLSKEDGDKQESNSITNQRELIYGFLKNKPDIQVCRERVDDGYSGINFDRPGIKQLLEEVKAGEINCIIVKTCPVLAVTTLRQEDISNRYFRSWEFGLSQLMTAMTAPVWKAGRIILSCRSAT